MAVYAPDACVLSWILFQMYVCVFVIVHACVCGCGGGGGGGARLAGLDCVCGCVEGMDARVFGDRVYVSFRVTGSLPVSM